MKKLKLTACLIASVATLLVVLAPVIYNKSEQRAHMTKTAYCQMDSVGIALNKYYNLHNQYPNEQNWQGSIHELIEKPSCNTDVNYVDSQLNDIYGNKYKYTLKNKAVNLSLENEIKGLMDELRPKFNFQLKNGRYIEAIDE